MSVRCTGRGSANLDLRLRGHALREEEESSEELKRKKFFSESKETMARSQVRCFTADLRERGVFNRA